MISVGENVIPRHLFEFVKGREACFRNLEATEFKWPNYQTFKMSGGNIGN